MLGTIRFRVQFLWITVFVIESPPVNLLFYLHLPAGCGWSSWCVSNVEGDRQAPDACLRTEAPPTYSFSQTETKVEFMPL